MKSQDPDWAESGLLATAEKSLRYSIAHGLTAVLFVLSIVPIPLVAFENLSPPLVLIAIYFWALYRPTFLPPTLVFFIGLLTDILSGAPLGMNALIYVSLYGLIRSQRVFLLSQGFFLVWWGFLLSGFAAALLHWSLFCLFNLAFVPVLPALMGAFAAACLFPLAALLLSATHRLLSHSLFS